MEMIFLMLMALVCILVACGVKPVSLDTLYIIGGNAWVELVP